MESLSIVVDCGMEQLEMLIMTARHIILVSLHANALSFSGFRLKLLPKQSVKMRYTYYSIGESV